MTTIVTRNNKNSELTYTEGDNNFSRDLKTAVADPAPIDITDNRTTYECTGTFDFTLVAASTLIQPTALAYADDFEITIKNVGTGVITVKTTGDTLDGVAATGDQAISANECFTYKVNDAVDGWISTAKVSANALSATAVITDDALVKGDGGARGVQTTGIIVADTSNNVTGMGTLTCGAITSASISGTSATVTGAVQAAITTCANLTTVGIVSSGTWRGADVGVAYGGTGVSTLAIHGVVVGNAASPVAVVTEVTTAGKVLVSASAADPAWEIPKYMFTANISNTIPAGTTAYVLADGNPFNYSTTATDYQIIVPFSGTVKGIYARAVTNTLTGGSAATTITVMKETVAQTVEVVITTNSEALFQELTNSFSVTAGERINLSIAAAGTAGGITDISVSLGFY